LRALSNEQGFPVQAASNSFVDITIPGQGPIALNSFWTTVMISVIGGLATGVCVLVFTLFYRLIFHKKSSLIEA
jgi:ABC-type Fe3+ transport system permease subunit